VYRAGHDCIVRDQSEVFRQNRLKSGQSAMHVNGLNIFLVSAASKASNPPSASGDLGAHRHHREEFGNLCLAGLGRVSESPHRTELPGVQIVTYPQPGQDGAQIAQLRTERPCRQASTRSRNGTWGALRRPRPSAGTRLARPAHVRKADGHAAVEERGDFARLRAQRVLFAGLSHGHNHRQPARSLVRADARGFQQEDRHDNGRLDRQHDALNGDSSRRVFSAR